MTISLIVRRAGGLRRRPRVRRRHRAGVAAHVHHDDLVAETVHLHEGMVGEHAHGSLVAWTARLIWANARDWPVSLHHLLADREHVLRRTELFGDDLRDLLARQRHDVEPGPPRLFEERRNPSSSPRRPSG